MTYNFNVLSVLVESFEINDMITLYTNGDISQPSSISVIPQNILPVYAVNKITLYLITNNAGDIITLSDSGIVTAVNEGSASISVTIGDITKSIDIEVITLLFFTMETSTEEMNLSIGNSARLNYYIKESGEYYINQSITYQTFINGVAADVSTNITIQKNIGYLYISAISVPGGVITLRIICSFDTSIYKDVIINILP